VHVKTIVVDAGGQPGYPGSQELPRCGQPNLPDPSPLPVRPGERIARAQGVRRVGNGREPRLAASTTVRRVVIPFADGFRGLGVYPWRQPCALPGTIQLELHRGDQVK
jgi:alpha-D-ribose 1-methylphosphonate 5-phosphate C-P lyase